MLELHKSKKIFKTNLISTIAATQNLNEAFNAVYNNRKKYHHNNDIWHLSSNWLSHRKQIQNDMLNGTYHLEPVSIKHIKGNWCAKDTVVLRAILNVLNRSLKQTDLFNNVYHLIGNGGVKKATTDAKTAIDSKSYRHLIKSDVASFYASTNHSVLLKECKKYIKDKKILQIIKQYANRLEDYNGEYIHITQGISKGCPLSPLMGAIMLKSLDNKMPENVKYIRFMDDWLILTKTKSVLRKCVKIMHRVMKGLKYKLALDKTFIGKISRGFRFLGQRFDDTGLLGPINKTMKTNGINVINN